MKTFLKLPSFVLFFYPVNRSAGVAQCTKKANAKDSVIKSLIDSQRYVFYAQYVTPMSGRQRYLTTDYTVLVSKDTVAGDLPYFGRAYSAPISTSGGGINFTSTNFSYNLEPKKKGGWTVTIKPKDVSDIQQFTMSVFTNGAASLQVTSINRQPISFSGYIQQQKTK